MGNGEQPKNARQHLPRRDRPIGEAPAGFDGRAAAELAIGLLIEKQGFALAGVAPVQPSAYGEEFRAWLNARKHGEMAYMAEDVAIRMDPAGILAGARAFIVVADQYATRNDAGAGGEQGEFGVGRVARYARGKNYHEVMKKRMHAAADVLREEFPFAEFRSCVDTAPVMERELAVLAGLGWQAKNTMVIHPRLGSYFVLGVIATTLPLEAVERARVPDSCGTCTRCIEACPTGAITPYSVDGARCISYLTIEKRTVPPTAAEVLPTLDWLAGCDVCQEVCPHNSARPVEEGFVGRARGEYAPTRTGFRLVDVIGWGEEQRRGALQNSALKRITLEMFKRNAVLAAGYWLRSEPRHPDARALRARLEHLAEDQGEPGPLRALARSVLCP